MWRSTFQKTAALSLTEVKYMVLGDCVKEVVWMCRLLKDIGDEQFDLTVIYEGNQGAMNVGYQARSRHIDIRFHCIREKFAREEVSKTHLADVLTKGLSSKSLCNLLMRSNVSPKPEIPN